MASVRGFGQNADNCCGTVRNSLIALAFLILSGVPAFAAPQWRLVAVDKWSKPLLHDQFPEMSMYGIGFFVDLASIMKSRDLVYYDYSFVPVNSSYQPVISRRPQPVVSNCANETFRLIDGGWRRVSGGIMKSVHLFACAHVKE